VSSCALSVTAWRYRWALVSSAPSRRSGPARAPAESLPDRGSDLHRRAGWLAEAHRGGTLRLFAV